MNTINRTPLAESQALTGHPLTIGTGFEAQSFRARDVGSAMDPLVMVDRYVMTEPTFGPHPHAGMSAVSLLFEDTDGLFHNRDSLGNDFNLHPGDLYWLKAGSGAVHDESPRPGARVHGLQVFVNVPQAHRFDTPNSLFVRAEDMPELTDSNYRVRVVLGESNGVLGATSPALPMTILDGTLQAGGHFSHAWAPGRGLWIHAIKGNLHIVIGNKHQSLVPGEAMAIRGDKAGEVSLRNPSREPAQFVLFDGDRVNENYVQEGPFVMGSHEEITEIRRAWDAGQLGNIAKNQ